MEVYIEYVIIDNFALTYLIGALSYKALKVKSSMWRNVLSSAIGTLAAVFYPFITLHSALIVLLKISLGILLSFILFYKKSKILISCVVFLVITFMFGGIFFGIGYIVHGDVKSALTLPFTEFPIGVLIAAAGIVYLIVKRVLLSFHKNRDAKQNLYDSEITVFGQIAKVKAFLDTGNRLYDAVTGLPVVVVDFKTTERLIGSERLISLMNGTGERIADGAHYMSYSTIGGKSRKLLVLKAEKFLLYLTSDKNIHKDVMLGLSCSSFKDTAEYEAIMGPSVL